MSLRFARSKIHGIVTNYLRPRTLRGPRKRAPRRNLGALESCQGTIYPSPLGRWRARRFRHAGRATADFADLESRKTADRDIFAQLGDGLGNHLADGYALVLDVVLF